MTDRTAGRCGCCLFFFRQSDPGKTPGRTVERQEAKYQFSHISAVLGAEADYIHHLNGAQREASVRRRWIKLSNNNY